jgi:hypothetical protein
MNTVRKYSGQVEEGTFRFQQLKSFLNERRLPNAVWISEDATRITGRVEYDAKTNRCVGFVLPLDDRGLPQHPDVFSATSAEKIEHMFKTYSVARNAYVIMARPLQQGVPSFCLTIFGTDNKFKTSDVLRRWKYMKEEAAKVGIVLMGFSADGGELAHKIIYS